MHKNTWLLPVSSTQINTLVSHPEKKNETMTEQETFLSPNLSQRNQKLSWYDTHIEETKQKLKVSLILLFLLQRYTWSQQDEM